MFKKIVLSIFFTFFLLNIVFAQAPSIEWQKCYGSSGNQTAYQIKQTSDGGYISCFYNTSSGVGYHDFWIVKLDATGAVTWEKFMGGSGDDFAHGIQQTADGGYIVVGSTNSTDGDVTNNHGNGNYDYWVVKLNNAGDITWQKTYGGSGEDKAWYIQQTTDGGYIVAGEIESTNGDITVNHGLDDCWIIKIDNSGNLIWQKSYGGSMDDHAYSVRQTADGGYIVAGNAGSWDGDVTNPGHIYCLPWIIKLNNAGNIEWENTYGSPGGGSTYIACQTSDGGYCFAAESIGNGGDVTGNHGNLDYWIVKLNATGNLVWQKSLGGSGVDIPTSMVITPDNGFVVGGWTTSTDGDITGNHGGYSDYWLIKVSPSGQLVWEKAMGGNSVDQSDAMCETADGGFMISGNTSSSNSGDVGMNHGAFGTEDIWLVKLIPNVMPVTLTGFDADVKSKYVLCTWQTKQEQNSSHFIVERSDDAVHFISLGKVAAKGNGVTANDYDFVDKNAFLTQREYLYYRLKMVDLDGSFKHSNTISVHLENPLSISIYPTPAIDYLNILFYSKMPVQANLAIYDKTGKKVYHEVIFTVAGTNTKKINIASLSPGSYSLILTGKTNNYASGFIKVNK
ncbi:MAG: T9SS type A sorting domain-containing protein [Ferruginibacter sp.]